MPPAHVRADARLRVAFVTDTYAPSVNGVVRSVQTSKAALERLGAHVTVFAPGARELATARSEPGLRPMRSIETSLYPNLRLSLAPLLPRHLRGFDVVHVHTPGPLGLAALTAARREGLPFAYTYHTRFDVLFQHLAPTPMMAGVFTKVARGIERVFLKSADAVLAPSPAMASGIESATGRRAEVAPTGVDCDVFRPAIRAGREGRPTFLHLGRLSREKNLDAVLHAFPLVLQRLPDAWLLVGGSGPDESRLRALADSLGVAEHVGFLGHVPEPDLPLTYQAADVFVTASRFETQGLTVLEAMACATGVALADAPVFEPMVEEGAALAFDPDEPRSVADTLVAAYHGRHGLARGGLRFARTRSTHACGRRLLELYAALAARTTGRPSA